MKTEYPKNAGQCPENALPQALGRSRFASVDARSQAGRLVILDRRVRVVVIAAVRVHREGLARSLACLDAVDVLGAAAADQSGIDVVLAERPDVVLIDGSVAHQSAVVQAILSNSSARLVTYGLPDEDEKVIRCAEAGVGGYLCREASLEELVAAILSVAQGEVACSPRIAAVLLRRVALAGDGGRALRPAPYLTLRERQVIALVDQGLCNKEIAARLGVEVSTVKNHVHRVLEKVGAKRRGEAAARARRTLLGLSLGRPGAVLGLVALAVAALWPSAGCHEAITPPPPLPCTTTVGERCWVYLGPDDVHVSAVAHVDGELWIGTTTSGILRYDPWERSWRHLGFRGNGVRSIVTVPSSGAIWATVNWATDRDTSVSYLYLSRDEGQTWEPRDGGLAEAHPGAVGPFAIDPLDPRRLILGIPAGVALSEDGGVTWERVLGQANSLLDYYAVAVSPASSRRAWVGGSNLAFSSQFALRSDDGGHAWKEITPPRQGYGTIVAFLPHPQNPDVALASIWGSLQGTSDGGATWETVLKLAHAGGLVYAFAVTDTMLVAVSDEWLSDRLPGALGVYTARALDGPWTVVPTPDEAGAGFSVTVDGEGQMLIGTIRGVWLVRD